MSWTNDSNHRETSTSQNPDAGNLAISSHQGWYYLWTHQFDQAVGPLLKTLEMEPNFSVTHSYLGLRGDRNRIR